MLSLPMCSSAPPSVYSKTPNHFARILTCGISVMKPKKRLKWLGRAVPMIFRSTILDETFGERLRYWTAKLGGSQG
jgi:hypothetical protein